MFQWQCTGCKFNGESNYRMTGISVTYSCICLSFIQHLYLYRLIFKVPIKQKLVDNWINKDWT
jgi:hypothetical protein